MNLRITHPTKITEGKIVLGGSKSISNRVLIINYLSKKKGTVLNLSDSDDTRFLNSVLEDIQEVNDVHHAGTAFRFLTSVLSFKDGRQILTGSERMKQRPIGDLVDALRCLGANIVYLGKEGFPPLRFNSPTSTSINEVDINGSVSSQFLSSLALIAPTLPSGLIINIQGEMVSRPYFQMTLDIMEDCGASYEWIDNKITIFPGEYQVNEYVVESDWSSASYLYSIASLSKKSNIEITSLSSNSKQPDSAIKSIARNFGVSGNYLNNTLHIKKDESPETSFLEYDFLRCPDIAQTVFVMCAGKGVNGLFSGLKTLKIKETDRINASAKELAKINVFLSQIPQKFSKRAKDELFMLEGLANWENVDFDTYDDHRMAMAFAPLALIKPIMINQAEVVSKSYPRFWNDLASLGFKIEEID